MKIPDGLKRVPLFADLSPAELTAIAAEASVGRYDSGQAIFTEGECGGDLLVIKDGRAKVSRMSPTGRHQLLVIEGPGSTLGEVSLFDGGPYSATATAIDSVTVIRVPGDRFKRLCLAHPELAFKVIQVLGHRLRLLRKLVEDLSFATVRRVCWRTSCARPKTSARSSPSKRTTRNWPGGWVRCANWCRETWAGSTATG